MKTWHFVCRFHLELKKSLLMKSLKEKLSNLDADEKAIFEYIVQFNTEDQIVLFA